MDESIGDYWLYLEWEFILVQATETEFLNGEGTPLEWLFDNYDDPVQTFTIDEANDYIIIFIEEGLDVGYWFSAEVTVDYTYYIWKEPTTTTTTTTTITTTTTPSSDTSSIAPSTTTTSIPPIGNGGSGFEFSLFLIGMLSLVLIFRRRRK